MNMHATPTADALPVPRATIEEIERNRGRALDLYAKAFDLLQEAGRFAGLAAISKAADAGRICKEAADALAPQWAGHNVGERRARFLDHITKQVDRSIWGHLIEATDLERLMDKTAREQFRTELQDAPPPATAANCYATLRQLIGDADMIFRRGLAEAFSKLDRRFRSHDGFKIGSRIVLAHAFGESGSWNYHWHQDETLRDVERVFCVLDGNAQGDRSAGIIGAIDAARAAAPGGYGAKAYTAETDYFEVRVFKNGNAHVWFKRRDLVKRVNLLLAEHYGAVIPEGSDAAAGRATVDPGRALARNFGLFETSEEVAAFAMRRGGIESIGAGQRVLEPSCGPGALLRAMLAAGAMNFTAVEVQPALCNLVRQQMAGRAACNVLARNFLECTPSQLGLFDVIFMNPPFDRGSDCDHVLHALRFLKPGGRLVAIMSSGAEFREDARTLKFRAELDRYPAAESYGCSKWHDLPAGSFAHAGTMVNTVVLTVRAPL